LVETARARCAAVPAVSENADIIQGQAENADLSRATAVFLFLPPHLGQRIFPEIRRCVTAKTRIIAHEQNRVYSDEPADFVAPVFSADAMTVVYLWQIRQPEKSC
jgi:hypothetical protein